MVIAGTVFASTGARIQEVTVRLAGPVHGESPPWSGLFDLEAQEAARLMEVGASIRLRLHDGREGWCRVTEVDFQPGSLTGFRGIGTLSVPTLPPPRP